MPHLVALVCSVLATTPDRWAALAEADPGLLARRPADGEWSALQCLQHVVDTEDAVFRARVVAIQDGRDFAGFDPDTQGHVDGVEGSAPELAARLRPMRLASLETIATVGDADLGRTARHAQLGIVTMAELLNEWAAHDTMHLVQAERALMQAFIPASGPWRPYFLDHDVDPPAT